MNIQQIRDIYKILEHWPSKDTLTLIILLIIETFAYRVRCTRKTSLVIWLSLNILFLFSLFMLLWFYWPRHARSQTIKFNGIWRNVVWVHDGSSYLMITRILRLNIYKRAVSKFTKSLKAADKLEIKPQL